ncbi:MAG: Lrp/AsnC family transcriptional regulator [Pseudomonadota bacterium]
MTSLDALDIKILEALHANARLTNQDLSERVSLSASQCARRRQRLEEAYVIAGYRVLLDPFATGLQTEALIEVVGNAYSAENDADFRRLLDRTPEIIDAWSLTGAVDYMLRAQVKNLGSLATLLNETLLAHPAVARTHAHIALEVLKSAGMPKLTTE